MTYRLAADALVILHALFVAFVVLGGLPVLRWPRLAWIHLPALAWGVAIELTPLTCPLTHLEKRLRRASGDETYGGGFIAHYIEPVLYPPGLTPGLQLGLGLALVGLNVLVYGAVLRRRVSTGGRAAPERSRDPAGPGRPGRG